MENKDIILIILIIIVLYLLFCDYRKNKEIKEVKEQLSERFAGNSLSEAGVQVDNNGNLVIPKNVKIEGNLHVKDANGDNTGGRIIADTYGKFPDAWIHRIVVPDDTDEIKIIRSNTKKHKGYILNIADKGSVSINGWLQVKDEIKNNGFEKCVDGNCGITESIKNLGILATKLQEGGLTIPGNVTITGNLKVENNIEGHRIQGNDWGSFPTVYVHKIAVPHGKKEILIVKPNNPGDGYTLKIMNGWLDVGGNITGGDITGGNIKINKNGGRIYIDHGNLEIGRGHIQVAGEKVIEHNYNERTEWQHKIKLNATSLNVKYIIPHQDTSSANIPCNTIIPSVVHDFDGKDYVGFQTNTEIDWNMGPAGYMCNASDWIAFNDHDRKNPNYREVPF